MNLISTAEAEEKEDNPLVVTDGRKKLPCTLLSLMAAV